MTGHEAGDGSRRLRVLSWNLFHGRDAPPNPDLFTRRSRLLRTTERDETYVQVNRDLLTEFVEVLRRSDWDIALLQECPPRWVHTLAERLGAEAHRSLTSRNVLGPLRSVAARANPDLIGSNEGGSNTTLVRGAPIAERRELVIRERDPERRTCALTATADGICVANLHATNDRPDLAGPEVISAAREAVEWAAGRPLLLGGDLNLRPSRSPEIFDELTTDLGFTPSPLPDSIDHLLARDLDVVEAVRRWDPSDREIETDGRRLLPSDHSPVEGVVTTPSG